MQTVTVLEREGQRDGERKKEKNHACSTKPAVSKGSIAAWSKRLLTCQPSQTKSLPLFIPLFMAFARIRHANCQMHTKANDQCLFN